MDRACTRNLSERPRITIVTQFTTQKQFEAPSDIEESSYGEAWLLSAEGVANCFRSGHVCLGTCCLPSAIRFLR